MIMFGVMITIKLYIILYECILYCTVVIIISTCNISFSLTCYHTNTEFTDIVQMALYIAILQLKYKTYTNYFIENNLMIK